MLHLEIIVERLEREYDLELIVTVPNVIYNIYRTDGTCIEIDSPVELPDPTVMKRIDEPYVRATIVTPPEYIGPIMELAHNKRAEQKGMEYLNPHQVLLTYEMPLAELIVEFFERLKTVSRGYGSLDYELSGFRPTKLVKVDILVHKEVVDALSFLVDEPGGSPRARLVPEIEGHDPPAPVRGAHTSGDRGVRSSRGRLLARCGKT